MPRRQAFMDTSFVLALENQDDAFHGVARQLAADCSRDNTTLVLLWGIWLEVLDGFARLSRRPKGIELLRRFYDEQVYHTYRLNKSLFDQATALFAARLDKEWGLTDCVSFVLMRQLGISEALTADQHFIQAGFRALLLEESKEYKES